MSQLERKDIERALLNKGFILEDGRDHKYFNFNFPKILRQVTTKMSRGSQYKTINDRLICEMTRQLKLSKHEFIEFIKCTIDLDTYYSILINKKIIEK